MKKRSLLALVLAFTLIMSVCTCAFGGLVASAADVIPAYSSADHVDVIPSLSFTQVGNVGHEYNSATGTKLWADIANGREDNIKSIADAVTGAKKIYASGTLTYGSSAYYANSAGHYPFVPIASITYGSAAESGYLALIMRGKGTAVGLGIVRRTGDATVSNPFFVEFAGITGDNGVSHSFAYSIDTETNCLTMTVDGTEVVSNLDMDTLTNVTFNNYVAGFGKFYASGSLTNYRVYIDDVNKIPAYSSADHVDVIPSLSFTQVGNVGHEYNSETGTKLWADIANGREDNIKSIADAVTGAKKIYASGTLTYGSSAYYANSAGHYPFVPIASVTYGTQSGYLALIMRGKGTAVGLGIIRNTGDATVAHPFFVEFAGITGDTGVSHNFAYSIDTETNCLTMTVDGAKVISNLDMDTLTNVTFHNYVAGFGKFYASGSLTNYRVYIDIPAAPEIDEETQKEILSFDSTGNKENTKVETYDFSKYVAEDGAVYISTTVIPEFQFTDWSGPYVALAKTDYKASEDDTRTYYLGVRMSGKYGYFIALYADDLSQAKTIKEYGTYSNGTYNIPSEIKLTYKVVDGKVSAWLDGELILNDYSNADYNLTEAVLGGWAMNTNGYALAQVSVWVDNADYDCLGDLNGDMQINLLDFIGMNKIIAQDANYQAFNENVVAFNDEGTVGTDELIMMKKYLLGVIDKLEAASAFGEDTVPADGLL